MDRAETRLRCSDLAEDMTAAAACADWRSVSEQIRRWEKEGWQCSRELELEVSVYKVLAEVWKGRVSHAQRILGEIRWRLDGSVRLQARADYADTVIDHAAGRIFLARDNLRFMLKREPSDLLPEDVRFDALYDLAVLETTLGDRSQADERLRQIREAVGDNAMRGQRAELLTGAICYARGQVARAERHLKGMGRFDTRAPGREGLRLFYIWLCLEQGGDPVNARLMRDRAMEGLRKAGNNWLVLEAIAHELNMAIEALDRKTPGAGDVQDLRDDVADVSNRVEGARRLIAEFRGSEESKDDSEPLDWTQLRLKLLEAKLEISSLRLEGADNEARLRQVRHDLESVLKQAKTQGFALDQVSCHLVLAQLDVIEESHRGTADRYKQAIELAEKAGLMSEAARATIKRAEYRRRGGDQDGCRQDVKDAIAIWKKLGNNTWARRLSDHLDRGGCSAPRRLDGDGDPGPSAGDTRP